MHEQEVDLLEEEVGLHEQEADLLEQEVGLLEQEVDLLEQKVGLHEKVDLHEEYLVLVPLFVGYPVLAVFAYCSEEQQFLVD